MIPRRAKQRRVETEPRRALARSPAPAFGVRGLALLVVVLMCAVIVSAGSAQVPLELRGRRVVAVEIAGVTAGITEERELGIPLGVPVNRRMVRNTIRRLAESGRWADVQIDLVPVSGGVKIVAHLVPRELLVRVEVVGNDEIDDSELVPLDDADWSADLAAWKAECDAGRAAAAGRSLDDTGIRRGQPCSLRWIYVHMIEEYARHNGHADLIRELVDGSVGD